MYLSLVPIINIFISHARKDVGGHTFASVTKPMTLIELATLNIKSMQVVHFMGMLLELEYQKVSVSKGNGHINPIAGFSLTENSLQVY